MNKDKKKIKIAINGFGRIGRLLFKMVQQDEDFEIVAVNDLGDIENMSYLLNYDTAQKSFLEIFGIKATFEKIDDNKSFLIVKNKQDELKIPFFSMKNPEDLPWANLEVDVVAECTGVFNSFDKSSAHLKAGARKVVLSGPTKDEQDKNFLSDLIGTTVLMGVNDDEIKKCTITSNGSCTTNAAALPLKIMMENIGVEDAFLNTIHSYTATQAIVDGPVRKKDFRRGRAAAQNIVPTSTGSAKTVGKVISDLKGKFDGMAIRVPTVSGSLVDITFISKKKVSAEDINNIFKKVEKSREYIGILKTESEQVVSSDIVGDTHACIVDLNFTKVSGKLVKIVV
jgi:glyceraldehyde 3-phosphate dehydrogenase